MPTTDSSRPPREIVVVGGGAAGWLSALHVKTILGDSARVTVVESPDVPTIGVGEGAQPTLRRHLADLRIDELRCVVECGGSYKNGIRFDGWLTGEVGDHYLHPFFSGPTGERNSAYSPFQVWLARHHRGKAPADSMADECFPESRLMREGMAPIAVREGRPVREPIVNYAMHIDATRLGVFLRGQAVDRGVRHVSDTVEAVVIDPSEGCVTSVQTRQSGAVVGEFFLDCTGFQRLLMQSVGCDFIDFKDCLLNDRALAARIPYATGDAPIDAATTSTAMRCGWAWRVPLFERYGAGYVYSSRFVDDGLAAEEFAAHLGFEPEGLRLVRFQTGCLRDAWIKNCAAIGLAGGFIEPLEATGLAIITYSLYRLMENWGPVSRHDPRRDRFNRQMRRSYEWIRDFIAMHFCLSRRDDTDYWRTVRSRESIPESLQERLELYRLGWPFGEPAEDGSCYTLPVASEVCVLAGLGSVPESANCFVDTLPDESLDRLSTPTRQRINALPSQCVGHRRFLELAHQVVA